MKKVVKLSLLVLASLAVVGCGDSGLADRMSALEEKVEKSGFYAEKEQYAFEDEVTIYYGGEKLYRLERFNYCVMEQSNRKIYFYFSVVAYDSYIVPASIFTSFFLEWDSGVMFNTNSLSSDTYLKGIKNSEASVSIKWDMSSSIFASAKSSSYHNLLITIPGTTVPITRISVTNFTYL